MHRRSSGPARVAAVILGGILVGVALSACSSASPGGSASAPDVAAPPGGGNARVVDFSALTQWDAPYPGARYTEAFAAERGGVPAEVTGYHGSHVRIFGYAEPLPAEGGVTRRLFLLDHPVGCCPTGPPRLHQMIDVRVTATDSEVAPNAPILVTGTLEVGPWSDEHGYVESYFRLQDARWTVAAPRPLVHRN